LTSLTGLDNINAGAISNLYIGNNYYLTSCDVKSICDYLVSPSGTVVIEYNATGCNSQQEVKNACTFGLAEKNIVENTFTLYPNPLSTTITISTPTTPEKNTFLTIYNLNGQQLIQRQITEQQTVLNVSELNQGIYFVRVADDNCVMVGKFVKQ